MLFESIESALEKKARTTKYRELSIEEISGPISNRREEEMRCCFFYTKPPTHCAMIYLDKE